jgi:hypothetical protein
MTVQADLFGTLQTAAGIYLAIYLVSHMVAVFVLGRTVMKVDTDFLFATGAPAGLLHDPWNVRLIPPLFACGVGALHSPRLRIARRASLPSHLDFGSQRIRMGDGRFWRRHRRHNHSIDVSAAHSVITAAGDEVRS